MLLHLFLHIVNVLHRLDRPNPNRLLLSPRPLSARRHLVLSVHLAVPKKEKSWALVARTCVESGFCER